MYRSNLLIRHSLPWNIIALGLGCFILLYANSLSAAFDQSGIESDLSNAHCGGWYPFDSTPPSVANYMPTTSGVPGRDGDPLGDIRSGMARRIESGGTADGPTANTGYQYPDSAIGLSTACRPGGPPFFAEHPCQRPGAPFGTPGGVYGDGNNASPDPLGNGVVWSCEALCLDMNRRWHYLTWDEKCDIDDEDGNTTRELTGEVETSQCFDEDLDERPEPQNDPPSEGEDGYYNCAWEDERTWYCCSGGLYSSTVVDADGNPEPIPPDEPPNCVESPLCEGQECRKELFTLGPYTTRGGLYASYYRQYQGSCQRDAIAPPFVDADDNERLGVPVSCYGMYDEYDPKYRVSVMEDYSCVIANTYSGNHDFDDMTDTQRSNLAAVDYGQLVDYDDPPSPDFDADRTTGFDIDTSIWAPYKGGLSLVNENALEDHYNNDLTHALLGVDLTDYRAYPQLTMEQKMSSGALNRAFDDSVHTEMPERRFFTEWWQETESQMNELLSPPTLRVILPAPWVVGLDKEDPFILEKVISIRPLDETPESIEMILQAEEGMLGELAAYFERSTLLRQKEKEVPLTVLLADPVELRTLADKWCVWHMARSGDEDCSDVPSDVWNMMERLNEYADYVADIRKLRGELYRYETAALDRQKTLISLLKTWIEDDSLWYNRYIAATADLDIYRDEWRDLQNLYREFHDKKNFPWCMNQRFLTSVYSQLDYDWYPGRPLLTGGVDSVIETRIVTAFPRIDVYSPKNNAASVNQQDVVIDMSQLFTYADGLFMPVVKPTQVRLKWEKITPKNPNQAVPEPPPPLPPVATIHAIVNTEFPDLAADSLPPSIFTYLPELTFGIDPLFFGRVRFILDEMTDRYDKFWESLLDDPDPGTEEDCPTLDADTCVHVEMDMRERFERLCVRPAILLKEDFESMGYTFKEPERNDYDTCSREDFVCHSLFRNATYGPKGVGLEYPKIEIQQELLNNLRLQMFQGTALQEIVPPDWRIQYIVKPSELFPTFNVQEVQSPIPVYPVLTPPSSSSSSSS